jgi:beta-lactamase regulating signal transducer with metallopeptidase domain
MKTIIYLVQVSACTGFFYLFYHLVLRRLTFFTINRWYLLSTLMLSFAIPLITIPVESIPQNYSLDMASLSSISEIDVPSIPENISIPVKVINAPFDAISLLPVLYFLVAGILTVYLLVSIGRLYTGLKGKLLVKLGNVKVIKVDTHFKNSSFLNYIFINEEELTASEMKQIIAHEMIHIRQLHSIDKLLGRITQIILWFNPFA